MNSETRVYPLDPAMTQEQMAVTFAMTSRSPDTFSEIAQRVTADSSAEFNERWVLGYGHSSVAEHAVLHLAVENISRVACDTMEDNRLASYTEKSSRYQVMTKAGFHVPAELDYLPEAQRTFRRTCEKLFDSYRELLDLSQEHLQDNMPTQEGETAGAYRLRLRRMATDACRSVLPAALLANVGVTANARTLSGMISKLLSSELMEERYLGHRLLQEGRRITPTLLKHAQPSPYLCEVMRRDGWQTTHPRENVPTKIARLMDYDRDAQQRITEGVLYSRLTRPLDETRKYVSTMWEEERLKIINWKMSELGEHDPAIREFELTHLTLELLLDYGAYREFRRHRMQSCFPQPMTIKLGCRVPGLIREADLEQKFLTAVQGAEDGCRAVAEISLPAAQYLVTHAHQRALIVRMNFREAYHVFKLRTSQLAHESIREPMLEALQQIVEVEPGLFRWLKLRDYPDWWPHPRPAA